MKRATSLLKTFQAKLTLAMVLSMLFTGALSNFLIYRFALDSQFEQLRDKLIIIAQTTALSIDPAALSQIPLEKNGIDAPQYKTIAEQLKKIKAANPLIRYIYTMAKTDEDGIWQFIVDPDPVSAKRKGGELTSYPGDKYDASRFSEMRRAFWESSADKELTKDEWGTSLSGYAPIRNNDGKAIAIIGVDIAAEDIYKAKRELHLRALFILLLGISVSLILGAIISKRITTPLHKLIEGTRHIANGNLKYRVLIKGSTEINELAESFNKMALSLDESSRKLRDYFYRVVQSLTQIFEARDPYTKGHSDRVARYSKEIAILMGLPQNNIEDLEKVAILHDIGKLGIQDSILNKKEKLTEEEWRIIKQHPLIGEEMLKPIILDDDLLAIVRGHHERQDGTGYPNKLKSNKINIFTEIVSVADAYDAMISPRPYRPAMSKEKAVQELKNNSGTQFNTEVVDVLLKIIAKEPGPQAHH